LKLTPSIAVITNIDREHMESYGTWEHLQQAFADFANKAPFYGAVVACVDDPAVAALVPRFTRRVITYSLDDRPGATASDVVGQAARLEAFKSSCVVAARQPDGTAVRLGELRLRVPGRHNLLNAVGAVAVGLEVGAPFPKIAAALAEFQGAERRFQLRGEVDGVMVVDDYGHHPTEIAAVIAAARAGIDRRLVIVFQPHRYSRTSQLMTEFGGALGGADEVVLTDIYPAGEAPLPGITAEKLAETIREQAGCPVHLVKALDELPRAVAGLARPGDLIVTLGAGSIGTVADRILAEIRARSAPPGGPR
jgi:UDP-N-acetylmuramate--alanine ligase